MPKKKEKTTQEILAEFMADMNKILDLREKKILAEIDNRIKAIPLQMPRSALTGQKEMFINLSQIERPLNQMDRLQIMEELKVVMEKWGIQRMEASLGNMNGQGIKIS